MSTDSKPMAAWRAPSLRFMWWWQHHMGWPGAVAVLMLLSVLVLSLGVRPWVDQTRKQQLRAQVARMAAQSRTAQAMPTQDAREAWFNALPAWPARTDTIARLLRQADKHQVELERAEYVVEEMDPGLLQVRITLPVSTSYGQLRALTASLLDGMPHLALDDFQLEAAAGDEGVLKGRIRLSMYFRKEAP